MVGLCGRCERARESEGKQWECLGRGKSTALLGQIHCIRWLHITMHAHHLVGRPPDHRDHPRGSALNLPTRRGMEQALSARPVVCGAVSATAASTTGRANAVYKVAARGAVLSFRSSLGFLPAPSARGRAIVHAQSRGGAVRRGNVVSRRGRALSCAERGTGSAVRLVVTSECVRRRPRCQRWRFEQMSDPAHPQAVGVIWSRYLALICGD